MNASAAPGDYTRGMRWVSRPRLVSLTLAIPLMLWAGAGAGAASTEPQEVEIITLEGEPEYDRQRFAVGAQGGIGWFDTKGSGRGEPAVDFGIVAEIGLGQYGARIPWTLEIFASFAVTRTSLTATSEVGKHPNRFTEIGARFVYRGSDGWLAARWISVGAGIVLTSFNAPDTISPAERAACTAGTAGTAGTGTNCTFPDTGVFGGLLDFGFGIHEWTTRLARYGFGARVPVELSAHPGIGLVGFFYAQLGLGG